MNELNSFVQLRAGIYRLLGKAYHKEATEDYLDEMKKYLSVFETLQDDSGKISEGVREMKAFLKEIEGKSINETLTGLSQAFARIFLSTGLAFGVKSVVPHESVYLSAKGLTMQEQRDEVLEIYYKESVGRNDNFKEPEDHISAEMGFMALLSTKASQLISEGELEKADENMKLQQNFLNNHILRWAPKMCNDLRTVGSVYYQGISNLTEGFLLYDSAVLKGLLEE